MELISSRNNDKIKYAVKLRELARFRRENGESRQTSCRLSPSFVLDRTFFGPHPYFTRRTEILRSSIAVVKSDADFPLAMEKTTSIRYNVRHETHSTNNLRCKRKFLSVWARWTDRSKLKVPVSKALSSNISRPGTTTAAARTSSSSGGRKRESKSILWFTVQTASMRLKSKTRPR